MGVTVLSQNAFAPPADPQNQYRVLLGFAGATSVAIGVGSVAVIQVTDIHGSRLYTVASNWQQGAIISSFPSIGGDIVLDQPSTSFIMQGFLDGTDGSLQTQYVTYPARATFPGGALAICVYRVDAVGRIQEIDDYRDPAVFPGAINAKGLRSI